MDGGKKGEQGMDKHCSTVELQWQGTEGFRFALARRQLLGDGMYGGKFQAHGNGEAVHFGSDQAARMTAALRLDAQAWQCKAGVVSRVLCCTACVLPR